MSHKYTIEKMRALAAQKGGECLSSAYVDIKQKLRWKCKRGHKWDALADNVMRGSWCRRCVEGSRKKKYTIEDMQKLACSHGGECLSTVYKNSMSKLLWRCSEGHTWEARVSHVLDEHWCLRCSNKNPLTLKELQDLAHEHGGRCLSPKYLGVHAKHRWECSRGHTWEASPSNIKHGGSWCAKCIGKAPTIEDMRAVAESRGGKCLSSEYVHSQTPLEWECANGHRWKAKPVNVNQGHWCHVCAPFLFVSERICRCAFEQIFKTTFEKVRPDWLRNEKRNVLELDGFSPALNLAFEHQGVHHDSVNYFSPSAEKLAKRKNTDALKKKICEQHGVRLIQVRQLIGRIELEQIKDHIGILCRKKGVELPDDFESIVLDFRTAYKMDYLARVQLKAREQGGECLSQHYISNASGGFRFGSISDLMTNRPRQFQSLVPGPIPVFGTRETLFGVYIADDIRLAPGLNLSLGLRYEMSTVPTEAHNRLSNLDHLTDAQPRLGSPFFLNPTLRNFEPRVGITWSPGASGKTILRSGFGMFDVLPLPYEFSLTIPTVTPFSQQVYASTLPPGSFPLGAFQQFGASLTSLRANFTEHAPKRNYVMQWNFNIERQLARSLTATIGYVGSRGVHQPYRQDNFDMVLPTLTPAGYLFPPAATSTTLNPNFGRINGTLWQANSFYHALQAVITKSLSHGVQFHGAYTWSKSIDTLSATVADDSFPNGLYNQLFFDQRTTRGLSDFNVGQNFVVNLTWETPAPANHAWLAHWALSGWQLGGIFKASSGQPFTPILGGDPLGTKLDETSEPPNRLLGPGCESLSNPGNPDHYIKTQCLAFPNPSTLRGNLGRNTVIGPGLANLDFSLFKNNRIRRISENFNVQFRAEFFNVFNRANFSSPVDNHIVFDPTGHLIPSAGLITSTQTPSREIQFALKLIW